jgi:thioredoxin reductase/NAD-dependent dihydropyrimidine dehydrogenase PreA subunit
MTQNTREISSKDKPNIYLDYISDHLDYFGYLLFILIAVLSIARKGKKSKKAISTLEKNIRANLHEPATLHPEINPALCAGCGACVIACPEGKILQLVKNKAVLVYPSKCVGHGACEIACPFAAIDLVFGTKTRGMDIPRITPDYETNVDGLYIAGELGGMGLIRNAIKQGKLATYHAFSKLNNSNATAEFDIFIVGAGPAGFSAGLAAKEKQLKYKIIEQNTFGGTIFNFPRQKIVTSHPLEFPAVGPHKFKSNTVLKEEILKVFSQIKNEQKLVIAEKETFENVKKLENGTFEIKTSKGKYTAKKVIMCMGVRGSPRKLGLPNEDLPKVTYNLIDPEEYQNATVAIVGGGNAGLEAAQYLSKPHLKNKVHLIVRGGPADAFSKANEANQKLVFEQEKQKLVKIHYEGSIKSIEEDHILINRGNEVVKLENHYIFIFAGAEVPFKFLMSLGITIDKAHGEIRK